MVQLAGLRVDCLEDLGVFVVDHRLGGIDLVVEQGVHGEVLRHELDIRDLELLDGGEHLEFVAESPVAHLLTRPVLRRLDARVGPGDLERARPLEHLGDVDDVGAALPGDQGLRDPGDAELGATGGQDLLRDDLHRPLENLDIQALRLVEAVVEGDVIAGELRLSEPLQLKPYRIWLGAFLGGCGGTASLTPGHRGPVPLATCSAVTTCGQHDRQHGQPHDMAAPSTRIHRISSIFDAGARYPAWPMPALRQSIGQRLRYSLVRKETCQGISHRSAARISR